VPLDKIRFIPNGLREVNPKNAGLEKELMERFNLDRFILNVGGIHDRKNIVRLVTAFSDLVKSHDYPGKLLITGSISGHPYKDRMKRMCDDAIANTGMKDRVVFSGFVTEEELDSLFRIGDLLIYPSLYEGFGIPILEAMKMGLPVITSNVTGMPEVASDIADLIDPTDVGAMTRAMADLLQDTARQKEMRKRGIERAKTYTWERVAESYLKFYADTIALFK
jgi:glycosyltransferase involved in cell wall biosynthesis